MLRSSEAENALRFLAVIGPKLGASLSVQETAENICIAMIPYFSDRCSIYVSNLLGHAPAFWPDHLADSLLHTLQESAETEGPVLLNPRLMAVPLLSNGENFGAIAFELNKEREYTASDTVLASDLAYRASLALQNSALFTSVEATRAALIQAEKLATAGRMAAAIAHEINNPLEALTNLIYIIEHSQDATPQIQETAAAALVEVTRLAHITRQSLGFYRELRTPSVLDLSHSMADTLALYKKRFEAKQVTVDVTSPGEVNMLGIKGEIRQVISNLLVNALEATESGGQVHLETAIRGNRAWLSISDTGAGIPQELMPKVFEPFFTTKKGTGTGLGLWITQNIVEKHDGHINVSAVKQGTCRGSKFEIDFPLAAEAMEHMPESM